MTLLPEEPTQVVLTWYWKALGCDCRGPECVSSQVMRRSYHGPAGNETQLVHSHQDGRKDRYKLGLSLVLFRLVVPPL
jgi:hypothetical protein